MPNLDVLYVGSKNGMEAELIPREGYRFQAISCGKLRRYFSLKNFFDGFRTIAGIIQSMMIIRRFKPEIIFCKGGYVSLPVALAGAILGKPVVIHESDLKMGLANKIAARGARAICVSFPETAELMRKDKRVVFTGNPVRAELKDGNRSKGFRFTGLTEGKPVILVMGGSQGADFINDLIAKNLLDLLKHYQLVQVWGKGKMPHQPDLKGYFACEYLGAELKDIYAISDLIISRAGANSLAEIEYLGKPAILIPLLKGSRGDQIENAESFAYHNSAIVISEKAKKVDLLGNIEKLLRGRSNQSKPKTSNAARKIAHLLIDLAKAKNVKKT